MTDNGANTFYPTDDPILDLYVLCCRGADEDKLLDCLKRAWGSDPENTIKVIFNARDCRGGKGEKDVGTFLFRMLKKYKPKTYEGNMKVFYADYGCYKDIFKIMQYQTSYNDIIPELNFIVNQLNEDLCAMELNQSISMMSKWAPNERGAYYTYGRMIAKAMFPNDLRYLEKYRKKVLTPLRKHLGIVEYQMCMNDWENIRFEYVPARAMNLYKEAFERHVPQQFGAYLTMVKEGKSKINTMGLQPHTFVEHYMKDEEFSEVIEHQWEALVKRVRSECKLGRTIPVVDVSLSMRGRPLNVAIALSIITSTLCEAPFYRRIIPFTDKVQLYKLENYTLCNMVREIKWLMWGTNTDFMAIFKLILATAKMYQVSRDNMIKNIIVFTDRDFQQASKENMSLDAIYQSVQKQYSDAGYDIPKLVFWNLKVENTPLPVVSVCSNAVFVSGYSEHLFKCFMDDCDFTQKNIIHKVLSKYDNVFVHPDDVGDF